VTAATGGEVSDPLVVGDICCVVNARDRCQCEHCGYVFDGKVVFHTADGDEEFVGGDAYFVGPGHMPSIFAGTSLIEFSPTDRLQQTMEVVTRNMEAAAGG
jgi:hypothetical protein